MKVGSTRGTLWGVRGIGAFVLTGVAIRYAPQVLCEGCGCGGGAIAAAKRKGGPPPLPGGEGEGGPRPAPTVWADPGPIPPG